MLHSFPIYLQMVGRHETDGKKWSQSPVQHTSTQWKLSSPTMLKIKPAWSHCSVALAQGFVYKKISKEWFRLKKKKKKVSKERRSLVTIHLHKNRKGNILEKKKDHKSRVSLVSTLFTPLSKIFTGLHITYEASK